MKEVVLILFLPIMITPKSFLIKTKEDPQAMKNVKWSQQNVLQKFDQKCKDRDFCRKWIKKW